MTEEMLKILQMARKRICRADEILFPGIVVSFDSNKHKNSEGKMKDLLWKFLKHQSQFMKSAINVF